MTLYTNFGIKDVTTTREEWYENLCAACRFSQPQRDRNFTLMAESDANVEKVNDHTRQANVWARDMLLGSRRK